MEVVTLAGARPPHEDLPMDLTTTSRRHLMLHHAEWPRLRHDPRRPVECVLKPLAKLPSEAMARSAPAAVSRYIPIPKKRHCRARGSPPYTTHSPPPKCQSPWIGRYSPPSSTVLDVSNRLSPDVARKRARLESPKPSDSLCESSLRPPSAEDKNGTAPISSNSSGSDNNDKRRVMGVGRARGDSDIVEVGEGLSQSVMRPRQRQCSPHAGSSVLTSPSGISTDDSDGVPGSQLLTALLRLQTSTVSQGLLNPAALKDTEALLAAVHQSQILYYTYCSQLIQNLRAKQLEQQHRLQEQQHHLQEQQHHLQEQQHHLQEQQHNLQEHTRLDCESEDEKQVRLEDKCYDYEDDINLNEQDRLSEINSILRARLNSQETPQPTPDTHSPSAGSPCGTLPSSTTGGEDLDLSPTESCGGTRKRAPRALTGKHVRPGTGASASTLLTLRQKLQDRQKYREVYGVDPPQPTKTIKTRPRKR
nr:uncharacterized protein LOC123765099 [Procambarus clarkii]